MKSIRVFVLAMQLPVMVCGTARAASPSLSASRLADLPNTVGVAGPFVGVAGDALIVAGGTNFPDAPPWKSGTKTWHDTAYVLPAPDATWLEGFKLPRPLAYGVSITTDAGLVCIGGCDQSQNVADVFLLEWNGKKLTHKAMASLPEPISCAAGARIGSRIYVAGGQPAPSPLDGPTGDHFWALDLDDQQPMWKSLPTWPGPERLYAVAGTDGNSFFLFSGIRRVPDEQGQPALEYLNDAYCYDPTSESWTRLPDLPHANAAVASPAPCVGDCLLLLGRGADGVNVNRPLEERAGFAGDILCYEIGTKSWRTIGVLPCGRAAIPSARWRNGIIIASGEVGPGVRSNQVWSIK